jgi:hypothetical protein
VSERPADRDLCLSVHCRSCGRFLAQWCSFLDGIEPAVMLKCGNGWHTTAAPSVASE